MAFCEHGDNFDGLWGPLWCSENKLRLKPRILRLVFAKNHVTINKSLLWVSLASLVKWRLTTALRFWVVFWLLPALNEVAPKFQHVKVSPMLLIIAEANPLQWSWPCRPPCNAVAVWRHEQKGRHAESPTRQLGKALQRAFSWPVMALLFSCACSENEMLPAFPEHISFSRNRHMSSNLQDPDI